MEDHRKLEILLNDFERNFPQLFFAAYLGVLPASLTAAELGFWLLNQGAFETPSLVRRNDFGLLVVIDPVSQQISLTTGYALESLFRQEQVFKLLRTAAKDLSAGAFATAIARICGACSHHLRKKGHRSVWTPVPVLGTEKLGKLGLEPLRGGHQVSTRATSATKFNTA
ncbi:MAG: hypothetical protein R3F13_00965 [Prosthecobacter sp.]